MILVRRTSFPVPRQRFSRELPGLCLMTVPCACADRGRGFSASATTVQQLLELLPSHTMLSSTQVPQTSGSSTRDAPKAAAVFESSNHRHHLQSFANASRDFSGFRRLVAGTCIGAHGLRLASTGVISYLTRFQKVSRVQEQETGGVFTSGLSK
jgi:hypothetical protein